MEIRQKNPKSESRVYDPLQPKSGKKKSVSAFYIFFYLPDEVGRTRAWRGTARGIGAVTSAT